MYDLYPEHPINFVLLVLPTWELAKLYDQFAASKDHTDRIAAQIIGEELKRRQPTLPGMEQSK